MLILTRRITESLIVGEDVFITVLGIKGNQVRLGIEAPKSVSVHREEIYRRILDGEEEAEEHEKQQKKQHKHQQGKKEKRDEFNTTNRTIR